MVSPPFLVISLNINKKTIKCIRKKPNSETFNPTTVHFNHLHATKTNKVKLPNIMLTPNIIALTILCLWEFKNTGLIFASLNIIYYNLSLHLLIKIPLFSSALCFYWECHHPFQKCSLILSTKQKFSYFPLALLIIV